MLVQSFHTQFPVEPMLFTPKASPMWSDKNVFLPPDFEPSDYDVICGRGKMFDNHMGNRGFRFTIQMNLDAYTKPESKLAKTIVVNSIIEQVRDSSPNGGFVKRDSLTGRWFALDDESAQQKVFHAFHDAVAASHVPFKFNQTTAPTTGSLDYNGSKTSVQQLNPQRQIEEPSFPLGDSLQQEAYLTNNKVDPGYSNTITVLPLDFEPSNYDVICGRGKSRHEHIGNRRFRVTIEMNVATYMKAACRVDKSLVVDSIFDQIKATGPGFVKIDPQTGRWVALGDESSREKIGHAIRDAVQRASSVNSKRADRKRTKAGRRTLSARTA